METGHFKTCDGASSGVTGHTGVKEASRDSHLSSEDRSPRRNKLAQIREREDERTTKQKKSRAQRPRGGMGI